MKLKDIYRPVQEDLSAVDNFLKDLSGKIKSRSISKVTNYLLKASGKRIRPALLILSVKAAGSRQTPTVKSNIIRVASAIELIHLASLVHDDIIDNSDMRHSRPTVNRKWGKEASIALGDYLFSLAFELISACRNFDILRCLSSATKAMCEGELLQVLERDNLNLSRQQYFLIVRKKTASLFAASCRAGGLISHTPAPVLSALGSYGLNFGVAFQITDDYLDIIGERKYLGKSPGEDIRAGEITLPILNLWERASEKEKKELKRLLSLKRKGDILRKVKRQVIAPEASARIRKETLIFIRSAKESLKKIPSSPCKDSLSGLADFIIERAFGGLREGER